MSTRATGELAQLQACRGLGFHVDTPPETWPPIESLAMCFVIGDRQRSAARKLLRRFIGRRGLKRVLERLHGRWIVLACGRAGISATEARDLAELLDVHRDVFTLSRLMRGHVEIFHGLDPETRAVIIEAGKAQALRMAPIGGRA